MTAANNAGDPDNDAIRQAAAAALADVDALAVNSEDRKIVLKGLLEARLRAHSPTPQASSSSGLGVASPPVSAPSEPVVDGDVLSKIGSALKVDRDTLELIYAVENGEPTVVVSPKKLSTNKSLATRQLGQLVAAARQAAGLEEWTPVGAIRAVVTEYGRLDTNNFAASIQQMDKACLIRGKGLQREVKVTKPGYENTADLLKEIAGTST